MSNYTEKQMRELDYGKLKDARTIDNLDGEIKFTELYKQNENSHPYLREVKCLQVQTQYLMKGIQDGDWFAGRIKRLFVGIDPERGDVVEPAYFCQFELLKEQLNKPDIDPKTEEDIRYLLTFWANEATYFRCRKNFPEHISKGLPSDNYYSSDEISYAMFGLGGPVLDYDKLLKKGIPGLEEEIIHKKKSDTLLTDDQHIFLDSLLAVLDIFKKTANRYIHEARYKAKECTLEQNRKKYLLIADSLSRLCHSKPTSYHEAIQLLWLYNLISLTKNYGRMDVSLGDFLAHDLNEGVLTTDEALDITIGLWRQIVDRGDNFNNRIIIGGLGRRNIKNADRFALVALEAQKIVNEAIPQLSLRWHNSMDISLLEKAIEVLSTGSTMPIIYNDEINVQAVEKAFGVSRLEAEQYVMYGCGEYIIEHRSIGSPDAAMNVLKALDVTLHNGVDSFSGQRRGLSLGTFESFETFEQLQAALARQLEYQTALLAEAQSSIYRTTGQYAAFPALSLLYDDCIARAKPILAGGVRYLGGTIETFGNNSAADALFAIKKLVYDDKTLSKSQLLKILNANFEGFAKERQAMLALPKFGNDNQEVDEMSVWLNSILCQAAMTQKNYTTLDTFLVVLINNGDSVLHGKKTAASADGRLSGAPLSNGNQPSSGMDNNGVTALLNSMAKLPAELHAGATHNIKFNRETLRKNPAQVAALIKAYFAKGGTQIMITTTDKNELEQALAKPNEFRHIFVRVGGYSERFVDLPKDIQTEIINRTLY